MTTTLRRLARKSRACAKDNLIKALQATVTGRPRLASHYRRVASACREDVKLSMEGAR